MSSMTITRCGGQGRRLLALAAVGCAMLATATYSLAATGEHGTRTSGSVIACHSTRDTNELHLLSQGKPCALGETTISWNRRGAPGRRGPEGQRGKQGEHGPRGYPGRNGKTRSSVESNTTELAKIVGAILAALVAAVLATYALGLLLLQVLTRLPLIKDLPPARWVRRPSLTIETLDDSALPDRLGPAITGLLRGRVSIYRDRYGLELVTGQQAVATALTAFKDLSGSTKTAFALIRFLNDTLPRRRFTLCGELQPNGAGGVGITLALRREDGYDSLGALWAEPLQVTGTGALAYERTTVPAAAWGDHRLPRALNGKLLSRDPMSWAFFRAGLERHRVGETAAARSLYEQALGHDGRNVGALADLGVLERREGNFKRAKDLLSSAGAELAPQAQPDRRADRAPWRRRRARLADEQLIPDRYRVLYQLAALSVNEVTKALSDPERSDDERVEEASRALNEAREMAREVAERVERFGRTDNQLTQLIRSTIEPSALVLLASALALRYGSPPREPPTDARSQSHGELVKILRDSARPDAWLLID